MSSYVDKDYFYYLRGREILLYKMLGSRNQNRISQSGVLQSYDNELSYPDEDIVNGLRLEYTALNEPFVAEAIEDTSSVTSGIGISFTLGSPSFISDSNSGFTFATGDKIRIVGSSSNDQEGQVASSGTITTSRIDIGSGTIATEAAGQRITITQIPKEVASTSVDSTSSINLNKMLCLAVVDYVKAMIHEERGEIDKKEYYIKEFYSKLADNESNKRNISVAFPVSPFAVR